MIIIISAWLVRSKITVKFSLGFRLYLKIQSFKWEFNSFLTYYGDRGGSVLIKGFRFPVNSSGAAAAEQRCRNKSPWGVLVPETVEACRGSKENYEPVLKRVTTMKHIKCIGRYIFGEPIFLFYHFRWISSPFAQGPACSPSFVCQPCYVADTF